MFLSVIIPTKNRPNDLFLAIKSTVNQKRIPDQIVIVDQSENSDSENLIKQEVIFPDQIELNYIRDASINGLVEAKDRSLAYAKGDIVCFFEDDVVLEFDHIFELERVFYDYPSILGCSGIITNATSGSPFYRFFYRISHVGLFKDARPDIYFQFRSSKEVLMQSNVINGGLSAWRRSVFETVQFDLKNRFHMMEDFEFSTRVNRLYPNTLFITSMARLEHHYSPLNRDNKIRGVERKVFEYILYFKKNRFVRWSYLSFIILMMGLFVGISAQSIKTVNLNFIRAFFRGVRSAVNYRIQY
jgi:GT2 family glycosyltransferase